MIFVAVGTDKHEFRRLVKAADDLASKIKEKVVVQIGMTKLKPKNLPIIDIGIPTPAPFVTIISGFSLIKILKLSANDFSSLKKLLSGFSIM